MRKVWTPVPVERWDRLTEMEVVIASDEAKTDADKLIDNCRTDFGEHDAQARQQGHPYGTCALSRHRQGVVTHPDLAALIDC